MSANNFFIDTGALYAFVDRSDAEHKKVVNILKSQDERFVTSNYVVDELITLFRFRKIPFEKFSPFIDSLWNEEICSIIRVTQEIDLAAWALMKKYQDHHFSFTDCTSFVLMREYAIQKVCSMDEHFQVMGFDVYPKS
ncbi:MAG: PIN domain-containing protein [candidate division KSB1 bacterium]|nr:PIN domain-containing protein [candidate division KSB1 bacterium]MDZ7400388.1 PIN domain-containing protein [candidate division KSB1 bacterium]